MKSEKVLILGSNGYIGSALAEALSSEFEVMGCDRYPPSSKTNIKTIVSDYDDLLITQLGWADTIILLAGNSSVSSCNDFNDSYNQNVAKFQRLLHKIDGKGIKLIYASSSSVYSAHGYNEPTISHESDLLGNPINNYDATKQMVDLIAKRYMNSFEIYGLRFGTVNGNSPNMRWDLMVNSMVKSAVESGNIHVTNPNVNRPILAMQDLIIGIKGILYNEIPTKGGIYNMASDNDTVLSIAKNVAAALIQLNIKVKDIIVHNPIDLNKSENITYDFKINSMNFFNKFMHPLSQSLSAYHLFWNALCADILKSELKNSIWPSQN